MSGHPVGFYMARMILQQLGRECLVAGLTNPVDLFASYRQAAVDAGVHPELTPAGISRLREFRGDRVEGGGQA